MKILQGSLRETVYDPPKEGGVPMARQVTEYSMNESTYISDRIGLHKIENASDEEVAISLHLYTPPHAHNHGFNLFDENSDKKFHIKKAPLFSEHGQVCEAKQAATVGCTEPSSKLRVTQGARL